MKPAPPIKPRTGLPLIRLAIPVAVACIVLILAIQLLRRLDATRDVPDKFQRSGIQAPITSGAGSVYMNSVQGYSIRLPVDWTVAGSGTARDNVRIIKSGKYTGLLVIHTSFGGSRQFAKRQPGESLVNWLRRIFPSKISGIQDVSRAGRTAALIRLDNILCRRWRI